MFDEPDRTVMVLFVPLPILYVTKTGNASELVKVTLGEPAFWQTAVVPLIVTTGVGRTITLVVPVIVLEHEGASW